MRSNLSGFNSVFIETIKIETVDKAPMTITTINIRLVMELTSGATPNSRVNSANVLLSPEPVGLGKKARV